MGAYLHYQERTSFINFTFESKDKVYNRKKIEKKL